MTNLTTVFRTLNLLLFATGAALAASPRAGFSSVDVAAADTLWAGCALMACGGIGYLYGPTAFRFLAQVVGLWLVIAPWALGFGEVEPAVWAHMTLGAAATMLSFWSIAATTGSDAARGPHTPRRG